MKTPKLNCPSPSQLPAFRHFQFLLKVEEGFVFVIPTLELPET
jgi:hypothetical protein